MFCILRFSDPSAFFIIFSYFIFLTSRLSMPKASDVNIVLLPQPVFPSASITALLLKFQFFKWKILFNNKTMFLKSNFIFVNVDLSKSSSIYNSSFILSSFIISSTSLSIFLFSFIKFSILSLVYLSFYWLS